jgi:hypothetical protein
MPVQIQIRNGTAAQWTSANPVLAAGEVGIENDTRKQKFGDGTTAWNSLPYSGGGTVSSVGGTGTVNGITLTGTVTSTGNLTLGGTLTGVNLTSQVTGALPLANGGTGQTTAISAFNALAPSQSGNSGKYLTTDGTNSSWGTVSGGGSPGGATTNIQFNSSSTFGGSANLTWDGTNVQLGGAGALRFADSDNSNYASFQSPATLAANTAYTLPTALPTASGQSLVCTTAGVMSWGAAANPPTSVEYLVVAGGGGAGGSTNSVNAGGGGGGGYLTSASFAVSSGTSYTVTVGAGGAAGTCSTVEANSTSGTQGVGSVFSTISAAGGGGGGRAALTGGAAGGNGGSGGGGGGSGTPGAQAGGSGNTPSTTPSQGNNGAANPSGGVGGGGGGSSAAATTSTGAAGTTNSITGSSVTYAIGGNGTSGGNGASGAANSGTGGASGAAGTNTSGAGGSGVVVIAYPNTYDNLSSIGGGLTYTLDTTTRSGYKVYRFTAGTGTIQW